MFFVLGLISHPNAIQETDIKKYQFNHSPISKSRVQILYVGTTSHTLEDALTTHLHFPCSPWSH